MIRVRWTHLLRGSHRLPTALAMESVVDEFVFIVGPVLVTFLSTTGHATSGVVTAFTLAAVGSLLFAAQGRTEPPPAPHEHRNGPSAMRTPGLRVLFVVGAAVGAILGTLEIALVAFADEVGAKSLSGVLIAGLALGSMASGIGWGTVHWRLPLRHRLAGGAGAADRAAASRCCWSHDIWLMVPFVVLAGVAVSPSLISSFTLAEVLVPRAAVTEAFTWIGTALGLGVAIGASVAGKVVDVSGANAAFLVATVAAAIAAVVVGAVPAAAARARRARRRPRPWPADVRSGAPARGAAPIDELLAQVRSRIDRVEPAEAARRLAAGALLVDTRPGEQRDRDGEVPGAVVVDRNVLEWRLDPASPDRLPEVTGYDLEVIVLCNEGYSSSLVADTLRTLGLHRAVDVIGGFEAWAARGPARRPASAPHGRRPAWTGDAAPSRRRWRPPAGRGPRAARAVAGRRRRAARRLHRGRRRPTAPCTSPAPTPRRVDPARAVRLDAGARPADRASPPPPASRTGPRCCWSAGAAGRSGCSTGRTSSSPRSTPGRSRAGRRPAGWSQQRFARRRGHQTDAVVAHAVETAVRVLLPHAGTVDGAVHRRRPRAGRRRPRRSAGWRRWPRCAGSRRSTSASRPRRSCSRRRSSSAPSTSHIVEPGDRSAVSPDVPRGREAARRWRTGAA